MEFFPRAVRCRRCRSAGCWRRRSSGSTSTDSSRHCRPTSTEAAGARTAVNDPLPASRRRATARATSSRRSRTTTPSSAPSRAARRCASTRATGRAASATRSSASSCTTASSTRRSRSCARRSARRREDRALWRALRQEFAAQIAGAAGPGVHQDLLQLHQPPPVRHRGRRAGHRVRRHRPRSRSPTCVPTCGTNTYVNHGSLSLLFEDLLGDVRFRSPWRDLDKSVAHVTAEVRAHLHGAARRAARGASGSRSSAGVLPDLARLHRRQRSSAASLLLPLLIALKNSRRRRAGGRGDAGRGRRQHRVQLHALLLPRRPGARRRGGAVPANRSCRASR